MGGEKDKPLFMALQITPFPNLALKRRINLACRDPVSARISKLRGNTQAGGGGRLLLGGVRTRPGILALYLFLSREASVSLLIPIGPQSFYPYPQMPHGLLMACAILRVFFEAPEVWIVPPPPEMCPCPQIAPKNRLRFPTDALAG